MNLTLLKTLESRFEADLWRNVLEREGIGFRVQTYQDTAYDGLFVSQKGYASLFVDQDRLDQARGIEAALVGSGIPGEDPAVIAAMLDHTLLDPGAGLADLEEHIAQCLEMNCAAACVSPWMTARAAELLAGSGVSVCTVVGFPLGTEVKEAKVGSAVVMANQGAAELDVVINRGLIKEGLLDEAVEEMAQVAAAAHPAQVKVILEMNQLSPELTAQAAQALTRTGVFMVKTGSGFFGGAGAGQVERLSRAVGGSLGIKAAGGIKDLDGALEMIRAGAARLGSSSGYAIWREAQVRWTGKG